MRSSKVSPVLSLDEYAALDGVGLAGLIERREVSIEEVTASAKAAVELINPTVKAIVELYEDRLENPTLDLEDGPLRGVPFLIKDVGEHFANRKIENGSRLCEGYVVTEDSNFGLLVKKTGVNLIGRSHTPEYSMAYALKQFYSVVRRILGRLAIQPRDPRAVQLQQSLLEWCPLHMLPI